MITQIILEKMAVELEFCHESGKTWKQTAAVALVVVWPEIRTAILEEIAAKDGKK